MRTLLLVTLILTLPLLSGEAVPVVFDFNNQAEFSCNWKIRRSAIHIPISRFTVAKSNGARDGMALAVECQSSSGIALVSPPELDLKKTPVMRWRWRVVHPVILKGGNEPDDQAASVYICDGNTLRQFTVSYRWEVLPAIGSTRLYRYGGGALTVYGICLRNSTTPAGVWVEEERDVLADFRNLYKRDIMSRFAIGIGGNSQYTKSNTRVEIDYIEFHPRSKTNEVKK